jgi:ribonuclease HI
VIFGDGSGSGWNMACGWAALLIDREPERVSLWTGAMNPGTVNVAEIMAYVGPLNYLVGSSYGTAVFRDVHIFTDSEYVAQIGSGDKHELRKNVPLWSAIRSAASRGFKLHWRWIPRETYRYNMIADRASRAARLAVSTAYQPDGEP